MARSNITLDIVWEAQPGGPFLGRGVLFLPQKLFLGIPNDFGVFPPALKAGHTAEPSLMALLESMSAFRVEIEHGRVDCPLAENPFGLDPRDPLPIFQPG